MPLFDMEKICKKQTDRIFKMFNMDTDPIFSPRFKKFMRFSGEKVIPTLFNIATFFILLWLFNSVVKHNGIEALFVLFVTIYVLNLKLTGQKERKT